MNDQELSKNQTPLPGKPSLFPRKGILIVLALVLAVAAFVMFAPW